jgi:hypothetical protein
LLDEAAAGECKIAEIWKEMSGSFGVGICFDIFLSFSVNKDTRGLLLVLMRHDY